jgi:uncharacterized protein (TIGR02466 family)
MSEINVLPLFSTPVMYEYKTEYRVSQKERDILYSLEEQNNYGNALSKNTYVLDLPGLENLKSFLQSKLDHYAKTVVAVEEQKFYITNSWTTRNKTGEKHHSHRHPNSMLSGVFYLEADGNSPLEISHRSRIFEDFRFSFKHSELNMFNSPSWNGMVVTGSLIIFPSWLVHEAHPNTSNIDRRVLGFNSFVEGHFGPQLGGDDAYSAELMLSKSKDHYGNT